MGVLIDADILIEAQRGRLNLEITLKNREDEFYLSVITASELLHGVQRSKDAATKTKRSAFVEGILATFAILPIDIQTARIHSQLWADLESKGALTGPHDTWIAATCLAHGLSLATLNIREYKRIPGLTLEHWG